MIINTVAGFCIQYDKLANLLRAAWLVGYDMQGFQQAFMQLRLVIKKLGAERLVLELNTMPDIPVYDQLWLSANFMPLLFNVPLRQVVVVLSSQRVYNQQVVESVLMAAQQVLPFEVHFFANPEAALAWLTNDSPRLALLQAEWEQCNGAMLTFPDEVAERRAEYRTVLEE